MNLLRAAALCASIALVAATNYQGTMVPFPVERHGVMPFHLTAGSDGYLWVASFGAIARMTTAGEFKGAVQTPHAGDVADAIVAGHDGNIWFAESSNDVARIGRITRNGALTEYRLPSGSTPLTLAAGSGGVVFAGYPGATLGLVSYSGTISKINFKTKIDIKSLAYDSNGTLWYAGCEGVGRLTRSHNVRDYLVEGGCNGAPGVSVARNGLVWFSAAGRVGHIDASGKMRLFKPLFAPTSMTAAPDGNLWFDNFSANLVTRITPEGDVMRLQTTFGDSPGDIAVGPDGNLWVCGARKMLRIT